MGQSKFLKMLWNKEKFEKIWSKVELEKDIEQK